MFDKVSKTNQEDFPSFLTTVFEYFKKYLDIPPWKFLLIIFLLYLFLFVRILHELNEMF